MDENLSENVVQFSGEREKQQQNVQALVRTISEDYLFHNQDNAGYADVMMKGHRETWPLRSKRFEFYLRSEAHNLGLFPDASLLQKSIAWLEAKAIVEGPRRDVYVRVAASDDSICIDLGDDDWRAIVVDRTGWKIVSSAPVRFRRADGMLALPIPTRGGSIELLRPFINVEST